MNKHKWYNEIVAWAEGKPIQYKKSGTSVWMDYKDPKSRSPTFCIEDIDYRVKPNTIKYRIFLCKYTNFVANNIRMAYCTNNEDVDLTSYSIENNPTFDKWLTDWIELEVGDTK